MDCVYQAYADYLTYLGLAPTPREKALYRAYKLVTHGFRPQPTYGGAVPDLLYRLAKGRNMYLIPEHRLWTKAHYLTAAPNVCLRKVVERTFYGSEVRRIHLEPAVYLWLGGNHAFFAEKVPQLGGLVMAIQLYCERV